MRIFKKIMIVVFFVLSISIIFSVCLFSIIKLRECDERYSRTYEYETLSLIAINHVSEQFYKEKLILNDMISDMSTLESEGYINKLKTTSEDLKKNLEELEKRIISNEFHSAFEAFKSDIKEFDLVKEKIIILRNEGKASEASTVLSGQGNKLIKMIEMDLDRLMELKSSQIRFKSDESTMSINNSVTMILVVAVTGFVLLLICSIIIFVFEINESRITKK